MADKSRQSRSQNKSGRSTKTSDGARQGSGPSAKRSGGSMGSKSRTGKSASAKAPTSRRPETKVGTTKAPVATAGRRGRGGGSSMTEARQKATRAMRQAAASARGAAKVAESQIRISIDHDEIRRWGEERSGQPSIVTGSEAETDAANVLRMEFPTITGEDTLEPISWDEFFERFDDGHLALLYQDRTHEGQLSHVHRFVEREQAEAERDRLLAVGELEEETEEDEDDLLDIEEVDPEGEAGSDSWESDEDEEDEEEQEQEEEGRGAWGGRGDH